MRKEGTVCGAEKGRVERKTELFLGDAAVVGWGIRSESVKKNR